MIGKVRYINGWQRDRNVYSYPYEWQYPAKTEQWAFERLIDKHEFSANTQYICFPWATLIDALDFNSSKARKLIEALDTAPPRMATKIVTFCQHIYALKLIELFKKLGITDIFWSHKIKDQNEVDGIQIHPYPLYPVMHYRRGDSFVNKALSERKYLYSFIGSFQSELYLTPARKWIFELPYRDDSIIIERSGWHFEQDVYHFQLNGESEAEAQKIVRERQEKEYIQVMEETVFCLCPSGSGPNSIRLWEALEFGCIPVLISDSLDIADTPSILRINETREDINSLPNRLEKLRKIYQGNSNE